MPQISRTRSFTSFVPAVALALLLCGSAAHALSPDLPEAAKDGQLPRTYAGWTLGQAAPDLDTTSQDAMFPSATVLVERLSDDPRVFRRAFVHEGTVFRIEWKIRDADLDRDALIESFTERLGAPMDSIYAVKDGAEWSDGISKGDTTFMIRRAKGSDWLTVAVQDAGRAVDLWRR